MDLVLAIIMVPLLILFILLKVKFGSPEAKGKRGENRVSSLCLEVVSKGYYGRILQNVFIPLKSSGTTEIDNLFITRKGIFVIESKAYSGYIFGNEDRKQWTATYRSRRGSKKFHFFNPIMQNKSHIQALSRFLDYRKLEYFSVVALADSCSIKVMDYVETPHLKVCYRYQIASYIIASIKDLPDILSEDEVNQLYDKLFPLTQNSEEKKAEHVAKLRERQSLRAVNARKAVDNMTCPQCGGKLVLRTAKKGHYAGRQFYGCSNYPRCKFIKNI